jgi:hypothetical protein
MLAMRREAGSEAAEGGRRGARERQEEGELMDSAGKISPVIEIDESVEVVIVGSLHTIVRFKRRMLWWVRRSIAYSNVLEPES